MAAVAPQPAMTTIQLAVPPGAQPGQLIQAQVNGQTVQAQIPAGLQPGATFAVTIGGGEGVRLDAAANTVVNEAYASGQGTATLPDGSIADLQGFSLTRFTAFSHRDPGGAWTPYDAQCNATIAAAVGKSPAGGATTLPGVRMGAGTGKVFFEVRWGPQAVSAKQPAPPPEGTIPCRNRACDARAGVTDFLLRRHDPGQSQ